jgi:hypothetical protein
VKRLEQKPGLLAAQGRTISDLRRALEAAGIQFIPENGGGAGVRLRKQMAPPDEDIRPEQLTSENGA